MPFTGSHPAAVLPLFRSAMPASALVIGSMAPDLPLYAPTPYSAELSHQLVGAFTMDPLAGLALFVVWHALIRPVVVAYSPAALRRRLPASASAPLGTHVRPAGRLLWVLAALVAGALTHVVWDAFTHADGWAVRHLPWLSDRVGPLPAYEWAQYASGLIGAVLILGWSVRWFRRHPGTAEPPQGHSTRSGRTRVVSYALVAAGITLGTVYGLWHGWHQPDPVRSMLFFAATRGIGAGLVVVFGLAIVSRATGQKRYDEHKEPQVRA
jgi:Domain of unknown function (DUF4184)